MWPHPHGGLKELAIIFSQGVITVWHAAEKNSELTTNSSKVIGGCAGPRQGRAVDCHVLCSCHYKTRDEGQ